MSIDSILDIIRAVTWEQKAYDWDTWTRDVINGVSKFAGVYTWSQVI
jgi:hypothetical protein